MRICLANALILAVRCAGPQAAAALAQRLVAPLLAALQARREPSSHVRAALLQARPPALSSATILSPVHAFCASAGSGRVRAIQ